MAKVYGLPPGLFPDKNKLVISDHLLPWQQELRTAALKGYDIPADHDRELARFMVPSLIRESSFYKDHSYVHTWGGQSWLASADKVPFVPQEIDRLYELYREPRSGAHLIGSSYERFLILYCADDGEVVLTHKGHSEVLLIVVKKGVSVTLKDTLLGEKPARSLIGVVESDAQVTFLSDQQLTAQGSTVQHDRWYIGNNAQLTLHEVLTGGQQSWLRKEFKLSEHAQVSYTWLAALKATEQAALTTVQEHKGPESRSKVLVKSALCEQARSFYRGTIIIDHNASRSEADQQQRALMLSPQAKTCAIPSLEVKTHDVQCQHGSAAGKFRDDELWYLSSRGLASEQAQRLLLEGFFNEPGCDDLSKRLQGTIRFPSSF